MFQYSASLFHVTLIKAKQKLGLIRTTVDDLRDSSWRGVPTAPSEMQWCSYSRTRSCFRQKWSWGQST